MPYWRTIELWIKQAEQVRKRAVIPAINELRYASRQLINAILLLRKGVDDSKSKRTVERHLCLAEQYLINADHDVADAITSFFSIIVEDIDLEIGPGAMANFFPGYPDFRDLLEESDFLIRQSRWEYEKRTEIYNKLRNEIVPKLIGKYKKLREAEMSARYAKASILREEEKLKVAAGRILTLDRILGISGVFLAAVALALFFYLWPWTSGEFCKSQEVWTYNPMKLLCR